MVSKIKIKDNAIKKSYDILDFYKNIGFKFDKNKKYDVTKIFMNNEQYYELYDTIKKNYLKKMKKDYNAILKDVIKEINNSTGDKISRKKAKDILGLYDYSKGLTRSDKDTLSFNWLFFSPSKSCDVEYGYIELREGYDEGRKENGL